MTKTTTKPKEAQPDLLGAPQEAPAPTLPTKIGVRPNGPKDAPTKPPRGGTAIAVAEPMQPRSVLELCLMAARDPLIPPERLQAFLDMADQQERKEAETLFDHAMLAAQAEMPPVARQSYNTHTKSWWAKIEAIAAKIDPVAKKHGFTLKYGVGEQRIEDHYHIYVDVTWTGTLANGKPASFTKRYDADIGRDDKGPKGEGTKSLAQGAGSSITYGRRFLKCMVFDVQILGLDRDGNPITGRDEDLISEEQQTQVLELCSEKGIDLPTFQKAFRVGDVSEIKNIRFDDVIARLKAAPKQQKKKESDAQAND